MYLRKKSVWKKRIAGLIPCLKILNSRSRGTAEDESREKHRQESWDYP